jgi:hypothetical protein
MNNRQYLIGAFETHRREHTPIPDLMRTLGYSPYISESDILLQQRLELDQRKGRSCILFERSDHAGEWFLYANPPLEQADMELLEHAGYAVLERRFQKE